MNTLLILLAIPLILVAFSLWRARTIARRHPPVGEFVDADRARLHIVRRPLKTAGTKPPVVFLHGASGNLRDQMIPFADHVAGRFDALFIDRPGHGWSSRGGRENDTPFGQAQTIKAGLDALGIEMAFISGHSFGAAVALAFALRFPQRTAGILLLSPVSHPWPGGIEWHYRVAATPIVGALFAWTLTIPAGLARIRSASACVFTPNRMPDDYVDSAGIPLILRPKAFCDNARDISNLFDFVTQASARYHEIATPTVIVTGDRDTIVWPKLHALGLKRSIANAELVWVRNLGHKPDYAATDLCIAALEKLAGEERDLQALARAVERRLAADSHGRLDRCLDNGDAAAEAEALGRQT
ncbi:MAG TPA: alpha/beta hydrolase [Rhizobiaceae bacterium]|nr:alpha/beta hydrolase [Rhizobiaceae bacterium]